MGNVPINCGNVRCQIFFYTHRSNIEDQLIRKFFTENGGSTPDNRLTTPICTASMGI